MATYTNPYTGEKTSVRDDEIKRSYVQPVSESDPDKAQSSLSNVTESAKRSSSRRRSRSYVQPVSESDPDKAQSSLDTPTEVVDSVQREKNVVVVGVGRGVDGSTRVENVGAYLTQEQRRQISRLTEQSGRLSVDKLSRSESVNKAGERVVSSEVLLRPEKTKSSSMPVYASPKNGSEAVVSNKPLATPFVVPPPRDEPYQSTAKDLNREIDTSGFLEGVPESRYTPDGRVDVVPDRSGYENIKSDIKGKLFTQGDTEPLTFKESVVAPVVFGESVIKIGGRFVEGFIVGGVVGTAKALTTDVDKTLQGVTDVVSGKTSLSQVSNAITDNFYADPAYFAGQLTFDVVGASPKGVVSAVKEARSLQKFQVGAIRDAQRVSTWIDPKYNVVVKESDVVWSGGVYGGELVPDNLNLQVGVNEFQTQIIPDSSKSQFFNKELGVAELPKEKAFKSTQDLLDRSLESVVVVESKKSFDVERIDDFTSQTTFLESPLSPDANKVVDVDGVSTVKFENPFSLVVEKKGVVEVVDLNKGRTPVTSVVSGRSSGVFDELLVLPDSAQSSFFDDLSEEATEWISKSSPESFVSSSSESVGVKPVNVARDVRVRGIPLVSGGVDKVKEVGGPSVQFSVETRPKPVELVTLKPSKVALSSSLVLDKESVVVQGQSSGRSGRSGQRVSSVQDVVVDSVLDQSSRVSQVVDSVQSSEQNSSVVQDVGVRSSFLGPLKSKGFFSPVISPQSSRVKSSFGGGFAVFVRERGVFKRVGSKSFSERDALDLGAFTVANSPRATFTLRPSSSPLGSVSSKVRGSFSSFRSNFLRKGGLFIEKKEKRIKSKGEKAGITVKGILANKNKGLFRGLKI